MMASSRACHLNDMIYGVGIDLVKIERMKSVVDKWGDKFLSKVFTDTEIAYCREKKNPYLSFAVRFAAKEALIKAIASEIMVALTDIEVVNSPNGNPSINTHGKLKKFFYEKGIKQAALSLSHEKEYGIACVVLEK